MPTLVDVPEVGRLSFPDGMSEDQMREAIETNFPKTKLLRQQREARTEQTPSIASLTMESMNEPPDLLKPVSEFLDSEKPKDEQSSGIQAFASGLERAGISLAQGAMTRTGISAIAASALPGVGPSIGAAAAAGFGGKTIWDSAKPLIEAARNGDISAVGEHLGNILIGAGGIGLGLKSAKSIIAPKTEAVATGKTLEPESPSPETSLTDSAAKESAQELQALKETALPEEKPPPVPAESDGPGAARASEVGTQKTDLDQLTGVVQGMEKQGLPWTDQLKAAYEEAKKYYGDKATTVADNSMIAAKATYSWLRSKLFEAPKYTEWKKMVLEKDSNDQFSNLRAYNFGKEVENQIPDKTTQAAISKWVDSGGDNSLLKTGEAETSAEFKASYAKAQSLSPENLNLAKNIQNYFESKLADAIDNGMLEAGVEDYLHRIYQKDSDLKTGAISELKAGYLKPDPAFIRKRLFEYDYQAEKSGLKPVQSFAQRIAAYDQAFNRAVSDRSFIKQAMNHVEEDGRPTIDIGGIGIPIEEQGVREALLIKPKYKVDDNTLENYRGDYIAFDHPALRKFVWAGSDSEGKPIFVQGDVLVHKDAAPRIRALMEKPWSRRGDNLAQKTTRGVLAASGFVKDTMLDLSLFHPVQIGIHALEHRVTNLIPEISETDPIQKSLVDHGLTIFESKGMQDFSEGLSGGSRSILKHIPIAGEILNHFRDYTFKDFIPRVKMSMALEALERNKERFSELSDDDVAYLTARQSNAAFGEQNYADLGRHPSYQEMLRVFLLAPDFLEARARFVGQAATKYGTEQLAALGFGAAVLYTTARIANHFTDEQWHWDKPFEVIYKGRSYSVRTVQEDLIRLITDSRKFIYNRLNPLTSRMALETVTGRDYAGRKRTGLEQLEDLVKTPIPISTRPREDQKMWESFANAMGIVEKRASAAQSVYEEAAKFNKSSGVMEKGEFIYDPEKDPYRALKVALSIQDEAGAAKAYKSLLDDPILKGKVYDYMTHLYSRPFTGSAERDQKMYSQMSEDQKRQFEKAKQENRNSLSLFFKVRSQVVK